MVIQYLERCLLEWVLLKTNDLILESMQKGQIKLEINGEIIDTKYQQEIFDFLVSVDTTTNFYVKPHGRQFFVRWEIDLLTTIDLRLPRNIFIISGKRKDELEREMVRLLQRLPRGRANVIEPSKEALSQRHDQIFVLELGLYEGDKHIAANLYYQKAPELMPVFDSRYPLESISNLLLNMVESDVKIVTRVSQYGRLIEIPDHVVNDLMGFLGNGNESFVGWQQEAPRNLKASVFIHNQYFDYNHLLVVSTNADDLFSGDSGLNGVLYSYISKHNLKAE